MSDFSIQSAGQSPIHSIRHVASTSSLSRSSFNGSDRLDGVDRAAHAAGDRVELSDMARLLDKMRNMPATRQDRIDSVRNAISRGDYETADRINGAIDQLLQQEDLLNQD